MGEIAEGVVEGLFCQVCFGIVDGTEPGYPRSCGGCVKDARADRTQATSNKVRCPDCGSKVKKKGLADHMRDVHGK